MKNGFYRITVKDYSPLDDESCVSSEVFAEGKRAAGRFLKDSLLKDLRESEECFESDGKFCPETAERIVRTVSFYENVLEPPTILPLPEEKPFQDIVDAVNGMDFNKLSAIVAVGLEHFTRTYLVSEMEVLTD